MSSLGSSLELRPIRLLIFVESFHPYTSGVARRFKKIIEYLAHTDAYLIHIVTGCKGCDTAWENDPIMQTKVTFSKNLFAIDFKDKLECALPFLIPQPGLLREIFSFKPNVIHCIEHTPAATFFGAIAKSLKIPIVWSSHTNLDFYLPLYLRPITAQISVKINQFIRRTYFNHADVTLTVSQEFSRLLLSQGITPPIHIWKTGVDEKAFSPNFKSSEMRLRMFNGNYSEDKILLVSVGRLSPEKNFEFLLGLLANFPQTFLCIVGDGPYKESLKPLFPEKQTHFMGFLKGDELAAAYASADYFVYASVSETFGQVYLEAMSSGVPIVAAEGKQMKEFFTCGVHGYTWEPGNLNCAIEALNLTIKRREQMSAECRRNALSHSWTSSGKQIEAIYSELVDLKKKQSNNNDSIMAFMGRLVFYMIEWFFLMFLIVIFLLPFLKVYKPAATINQETSKLTNNKQKNEIPTTSKVKKRKWQHTYIYNFLKNKKEFLESFCSQIMLLGTCLFLSLAIFYSSVL